MRQNHNNRSSLPRWVTLQRMSCPQNNPFSAPLLKKILKTRIATQLESTAGPRCLYIEPTLIQIINFVYNFKFESEGPPCSIYSLVYDHEATDVHSAPTIIFFMYTQTAMVEVLASMIVKNQQANIIKDYYVYFVPGVSYLCMQKMEQLNISDKVQARGFNFDLIPLNQDVFSLEMSPHADPLEEEGYTVDSILKMWRLGGRVRNYFALGEKSVGIMNRAEDRVEQIPEIEDAAEGNYMIVLDRAIDYVTPMMTAFSYEGLLDLFFGIRFNQVEVPGHLMDSPKQQQTFVVYNPKDPHYRHIAGMRIKQVPDYLRTRSDELNKQLKAQKQSAKNLQDFNRINQEIMPQFLILQYHKAITAFLLTHINESPFINTATLEAATIQTCQRAEDTQYLSLFYPIEQVLKLEILSSQVSDMGSYFSRYEKTIYQWVLDCYHPRHVFTIKRLVDAGLLRSSKNPRRWKQICDKYDLIPDQPRPYTEIHTIYSALLVRFVELFLTDNLSPDKITLLSGSSLRRGSFKKLRAGDRVVVYVVGGVTHAEIQAFRILEDQLKVRFLLCTTEVTSGCSLIRKYF